MSQIRHDSEVTANILANKTLMQTEQEKECPIRAQAGFIEHVERFEVSAENVSTDPGHSL